MSRSITGVRVNIKGQSQLDMTEKLLLGTLKLNTQKNIRKQGQSQETRSISGDKVNNQGQGQFLGSRSMTGA